LLPPAGEDWAARLAVIVTIAAQAAKLPNPRESEPGFDGDALVWSWRKYLGADPTIVAADVRMRAWQDDAERPISLNPIHTIVTALSWPLDPRLRSRSRGAGQWSEDLTELDLVDTRAGDGTFSGRLSRRLSWAWKSATQTAQELLAEIERDRQVHPARSQGRSDARRERDDAEQRRQAEASPEPRATPPTFATLLTRLTPREGEVLDLVRHGLSDREIGDRLRIRPKTVHTHINSILAKTPFSDRDELTNWVAGRP
jgi:DNA-binding CsgD family transcriptional regulator